MPTTGHGAQCTLDLSLVNHHGLATAQGTARGHRALATPGTAGNQAHRQSTSNA